MVIFGVTTDNLRVFNSKTAVVNVAIGTNFVFGGVGKNTMITLGNHCVVLGF